MASAKEIQTQNMNTCCAAKDKACLSLNVADCQDCGIQSEGLFDQQNKHRRHISVAMVDNSTMPIKVKKFADKAVQNDHTLSKQKFHLSSKRWTLGPTKSRGPDF